MPPRYRQENPILSLKLRSSLISSSWTQSVLNFDAPCLVLYKNASPLCIHLRAIIYLNSFFHTAETVSDERKFVI